MQNIDLSTSELNIRIQFPEMVTSSSVGNMMFLFKSFCDCEETQANLSWKQLDLIFATTEMIDSVGLNLIKNMVDWAKSKQLTIEAQIHSELVHMILCSVWLDREMNIQKKY